MTQQFNEEEYKTLLKVIQFVEDAKAWGRMKDYVKGAMMYLIGIGAFLTFIKEPLFLAMGWSE